MLSLEIADAYGRWLDEASTVLDDELLDYFAALPGLRAFRTLRRFDPSAETPLDAGLRDALQADLDILLARARERDLPEPPAWVGQGEVGDLRLGEELGWPGLLDTLHRIARLLAIAKEPGMELWVAGE